MGRAEPDVRPPVAAIPSAKSIYVVEIPPAAMAVGLLRSSDWPAARHIGRCAASSANHRRAVGLLPLPREEFRQLCSLHSELRRRGGSICTPAVIGRCQWRRPVSPALRPIRQALARARRPQQNAIGLLHQATHFRS